MVAKVELSREAAEHLSIKGQIDIRPGDPVYDEIADCIDFATIEDSELPYEGVEVLWDEPDQNEE